MGSMHPWPCFLDWSLYLRIGNVVTYVVTDRKSPLSNFYRESFFLMCDTDFTRSSLWPMRAWICNSQGRKNGLCQMSIASKVRLNFPDDGFVVSDFSTIFPFRSCPWMKVSILKNIIQYSAKRWLLGCVDPSPRPEEARTRDHAT